MNFYAIFGGFLRLNLAREMDKQQQNTHTHRVQCAFLSSNNITRAVWKKLGMLAKFGHVCQGILLDSRDKAGGGVEWS